MIVKIRSGRHALRLFAETSFRWFKQDGETVKLISLPKFSETNSFVVLNLRTLDAKEVFFDGFLD